MNGNTDPKVSSTASYTCVALVEPWKLIAAHHARTRQDRIDRCASLIAAAVAARQYVVDLNVLYRRRQLTEVSQESDFQREIEYEDKHYVARAQLRTSLSLLIMSGPEELITLAKEVNRSDKLLHDARFTLDVDGTFDRMVLPVEIVDGCRRIVVAIEAFAEAARKYTS
ncbi:hypothetical protein AB0J38_27835 [Streptomyces sp. NPDC050095]|uniref:hypothetical protein n=1 Tax=unclassified Streptomyces TaxID=2593676 RepID=UPI003413F1A1